MKTSGKVKKGLIEKLNAKKKQKYRNRFIRKRTEGKIKCDIKSKPYIAFSFNERVTKESWKIFYRLILGAISSGHSDI